MKTLVFEARTPPAESPLQFDTGPMNPPHGRRENARISHGEGRLGPAVLDERPGKPVSRGPGVFERD